MDVQLVNLHAEQQETLQRHFTTAYHIVKLVMPFTAFPSVVSLQMKNGVELGGAYHSDQAARRYLLSVTRLYKRLQQKYKINFCIGSHSDHF